MKLSYLNKNTLSFETTKKELFGIRIRTFTILQVRLNHRKYYIKLNVIFKVDIGTPITTLTGEVLHKLYDKRPTVERTDSERYTIKMNSRQMHVSKSVVLYHNLSIIGADLMGTNIIRLVIDYSLDLKEKVEIIFDHNVPIEEL